ncbi:PAS domain-containing protein [Xanthobacter agilis]|uniref:PAS domain-containing protein n=1 Tax=Xanthobacter agilis TaxID=47492 RepID=UPI00372C0AB2
MMTETKARALDLTDPRLAPLRRDDLPSFLVDAATAAVLAVTAACGRFGIGVDHRLPPQITETVRALAGGRTHAHGAALVRLRLPRSLTPRVFRGLVLDLEGGPVVLLADPSALLDDPAFSVEAGAPAPSAAPRGGLEALDPAVRFTFETDADDRILALSPSLAMALGARADAWNGSSFPALEDAGRIVSGRALADALATGTSFSGVRVTVPGTPILDLELGGVPLFDAARRRVATRGFGVLRRWTVRPEPAPTTCEIAPDDDVRMSQAAGTAPMDRDLEQTLARAAGRSAARAMGRSLSNVLPFNGLTPRESNYFDEIGRTLEAAMRSDAPRDEPGPTTEPPSPPPSPSGLDVLDALPVATLLADGAHLAHANRTFLQWTGWPDVAAVRDAGGLDGVLHTDPDGESRLLAADGHEWPVDTSESAADFYAPGARLHLLQRRADEDILPLPPELSDPRRDALDLVPWPVLLIDAAHRILFANRAAEVRLGFAASELEHEPITIVIAPEARGEAIGWLDRAAAGENDNRPLVLALRPRDGEAFRALAALAAVGEGTGQTCVVLGPEPPPEADTGVRATASAPPEPRGVSWSGADNDGGAAPEAVAPVLSPAPEPTPATAGEDVPPALHLVARRLAESLGPSFSTLADYAPDDAPDLPGPVRDALERVQGSLDDLAALAAPLAETDGSATDVATVVRAALAHALPLARRRHVAVRTDISAVPQIVTRPARLARLVRLLIEEALDGAPPDTAIAVSLLCDAEADAAPVMLQVSDAGQPVDEIGLEAACDPTAPSVGSDRFSRAGRPLRYARLAAEAADLGAALTLRRGQARGMTSLLSLPR